MNLNQLKDGQSVFLLNNKKEIIEKCVLVGFNFYPLKFGYMKESDNNLYVLNEKDLNNMYGSIDEAESNIYNLFSQIAN